MPDHRISIIPATADHIEQLGGMLRWEDYREAMGLINMHPLEGLRADWKASDFSYAALLDGEHLIGAWGLIADHTVGGSGVAWLMTSIHAEAAPIEYTKLAKLAVRDMLKRCPEGVRIMVDEEYEKALRWTRLLGFEWIAKFTVRETGSTFKVGLLLGG